MGPAYTKPKYVKTVYFDDGASLPPLAGKVVAITGCTTGTGYVAARTCARKGAHVIMLNRTSERSAKAEAALRDEGTVTPIECDLQSFESVRAAAATMREKFAESGVDVMFNNAAVMALRDRATADGYDVQMQTNHLSHFLLNREVMPLLEKAAADRGGARIVTHSSLARKGPPLEERYFGKNGDGHLGGDGNSMICGGARWKRYHQSKLANTVYTLALQERLETRGCAVAAVACAPGLAATNLQSTTYNDGGMYETFVMSFAQSAEDGTMPLLHAGLDGAVKGGEFWEPGKGGGAHGPPARTDLSKEKECVDPAVRARLWAWSEAAVGPWAL